MPRIRFLHLVIGLFALVLLSACVPVTPPPAAESEAAAPAGAAITVEDALGRTVEFAQPPTRIAVAGRGTYMVTGALWAFPEAQTKVAAVEGGRFNDPTTFLPWVDPTFSEKTILERNAGPEQIAPVSPDAIVLKTTAAEDLGKSLDQLGVPIVYVEMESVEQYFDDLATMGQLLGAPERAQTLIDFLQTRLDRVTQGVADVAEADKPSVLVVQHSSEGGEVSFEVPPASWLQTRLVELAGGTPVWLEAAPGGGWATVNFEQIAQWNPDKVFVIHYQSDPAEAVAALNGSPEWQALAATQNGEIYGFPADTFGWDSPDPRWILGLQWLAGKIHPDRFADLDIMQEVRTFFSEVYGMSDESIEANIIPTLKGDLP